MRPLALPVSVRDLCFCQPLLTDTTAWPINSACDDPANVSTTEGITIHRERP
jgi:hypothetical protein